MSVVQSLDRSGHRHYRHVITEDNVALYENITAGSRRTMTRLVVWIKLLQNTFAGYSVRHVLPDTIISVLSAADIAGKANKSNGEVS